MIIRASLTVPDIAGARLAAEALRVQGQRWGKSTVLTLQPDDRQGGMFVLHVRVSGTGRRSVGTMQRIANTFASGAWKFHLEDTEEAYAVWDRRDGGGAAVPEVTWLCLELDPEDDRPPGQQGERRSASPPQ